MSADQPQDLRKRKAARSLPFRILFLFLFPIGASAALVTKFTHERNIANNPHVIAVIEKQHAFSGRGGSQYISISFPQQIDGANRRCRVDDINVGANTIAPDQKTIEIAVSPDSCEDPELIGPDSSWWAYIVATLSLTLVWIVMLLGVRRDAKLARSSALGNRPS